MPENRKLYDELVARYGGKRAEGIYWGMVGEGKGPFSESGKYHFEHVAWAKRAGVSPVGTTRSKKPRASRPGAGRGARGHSFKRKRG